MNTDADPGEGVHLAGEAGLLGIRLQICVHLCSSVIELPFLGSKLCFVGGFAGRLMRGSPRGSQSKLEAYWFLVLAAESSSRT